MRYPVYGWETQFFRSVLSISWEVTTINEIIRTKKAGICKATNVPQTIPILLLIWASIMRPVSFNLLFLRTIDPLNFFFTSYNNPTSETVIIINGTMIPSCQKKYIWKKWWNQRTFFFMRICKNIVLINFVVENYLPKSIKKNKGFLVDRIFPSSLAIVQLNVAFS